MERGRKTFVRAATAALAAEMLLFGAGLSWLAILTGSVTRAIQWGLYWFLFAEVIKILMAAALSIRLKGTPKVQG